MSNIKEDVDGTVNLNPNMNVQGMGDVTNTSGDVPNCLNCDDEEKDKKKKHKFVYIQDIEDFFKATK